MKIHDELSNNMPITTSPRWWYKKTTLKAKAKQKNGFWITYVKDCLLPRGNKWSLDFLGIYKAKKSSCQDFYSHMSIPKPLPFHWAKLEKELIAVQFNLGQLVQEDSFRSHALANA